MNPYLIEGPACISVSGGTGMDYESFVASKMLRDTATGLQVEPDINPQLFPFQADIVRWALKRGRAAIFADCGMGKTPMQLEWARHIPGKVLILAPLAVAAQTVREAQKFGIDQISYARNQDQVDQRITVANYEMLDRFEPSEFMGVVLDESSILKAYDGKTRNQIIGAFFDVPFRLACTATAAPNDYMELGNHSEFLGTMTRTEMLATFFVHDGGETQSWRLKGHAQADFWRWVCSWAVTIRKPSDLGYEDGGFVLPPLAYHEHVIHAEQATEGMLFAMPAASLQERIAARRDTTPLRVAECARIVTKDEPWVIWCNLNVESEALAAAVPGAVELRGSDSVERKESILAKFAAGEVRVLVTKTSIAGFGLNWQHCRNVAFVGLSDSWESYYQAIRRCWRFGQSRAVNVHVISSDIEGAVVANIKRKEADAAIMADEMLAHMRDLNAEALRGASVRTRDTYATETREGDGWTLHLGDCVDVLKSIKSDSLHYSVFSPPFASLYTYSASDRDMGNCRDDETFFAHFGFAVAELYRALMPGRLVSFHCMNLPTSKQNHGYIGIRDFRGDLIRLFESKGFIYHSEVCIWKDPVTAMQRTKALGLLHKQIRKDSCMSRQGIPDYLVTMRKLGDNPERVEHTSEDFPVQLWQQYASPVWMDINPSETLQFRSAREHNDERHICPLQLEVIRRALKLWSNPGDTVFSPFTGIGSEGYCALQFGRRFIGAELKRSYFEQACRNLDRARTDQGMLFEVEQAGECAAEPAVEQ
jgi:superfamily II DNA or RNA helicase